MKYFWLIFLWGVCFFTSNAQNDCDTAQFNTLARKIDALGKYPENRNKLPALLVEMKRLVDRECNDILSLRRYYHFKAYYFYQIGEGDSVIYYGEKSLRGLNELTAIPLLQQLAIGGYNILGQVYAQKGDFPKALSTFRKMHQQARLSRWNTQQIAALQNIAIVYANLGLFKEALKHNFQVLRLLEERKDTLGIANLHLNLGATYQFMHQNVEANKHGTLALTRYRQLNDSIKIASALNLIATTFASQKNNQDALKYFIEANQIFYRNRNYYNQVQTLLNIGIMYGELSIQDSARKTFNAALDICKQMGFKDEVAKILTQIARLEGSSRLDDIKLLYEAAKIAKETGDISTESCAYQYLSTNYYMLHNYSEAYRYQSLYQNLKDKLNNEDLLGESGRLEAAYEVEKADAEARKAEETKRQDELRQIKERNNRQYIAISGAFAALFIVFYFWGRRRLSAGFQAGLIFVGLLLFFEFIRLPIQPNIEALSGGVPILKFGVNIVLTLIILTAQTFLQKMRAASQTK